MPVVNFIFLCFTDKIRYINIIFIAVFTKTAIRIFRAAALQTSFGFRQGLFFIKSLINFVEVIYSFTYWNLISFLAFNFSAVFKFIFRNDGQIMFETVKFIFGKNITFIKIIHYGPRCLLALINSRNSC